MILGHQSFKEAIHVKDSAYNTNNTTLRQTRKKSVRHPIAKFLTSIGILDNLVIFKIISYCKVWSEVIPEKSTDFLFTSKGHNLEGVSIFQFYYNVIFSICNQAFNTKQIN